MADAVRNLHGRQRILECCICYYTYNTTTKIPKTLPCGHTFCLQCLQNVQNVSQVKCSNCRQDHNLPNGNADEIPTNFMALELLESTCEECLMQPWVLKCFHCKQKLCDSCEQIHRQKEWQDIKEDLIHAKKSLSEISCSSEDDTFSKEDHRNQETAERQVTEFWTNVKKVADTRMEKDMKEIQDHFQDKNKTKSAWQTDFDNSSEKATSVISECLSQFGESYSSESASTNLDDIKYKYMQAIKDVNQKLLCKPSAAEVNLDKIKILEGMLESDFFDGVVKICSNSCQENLILRVSTIPMPSEPCAENRLRPDYASASCRQILFLEQVERQSPRYIAVSPVTGSVVISDVMAHTVYYYNNKLEWVAKYRCQDSLQGITINQNCTVFINHTAPGSVIHATDENGKCFSKIKPDIKHISALAVDDTGLLYICDKGEKKIHVIQADGTSIRSFGEFKSAPSFITVSNQGQVVVSEYDGNLQFYATQGEHIRTIREQQPGSFARARGVAVDGLGNIIVADAAGCIVVLKEDGQLICRIGSAGSKEGQFTDPQGIALTADGHILICDAGNKRVQQFTVPKVNY